jgi:protein TonB
MFNNLIESSSHAKEFKRRGSFLLFTTATYLVLFVITGVISIYAYDAHLEAQSTEWEITFVPVVPPEAPPEVVRPAARPPADTVTPGPRSTRPVLYEDVANPRNAPPNVSSAPQPIPPAHSWSEIGPTISEPVAPPGSKTGTGIGTGPVVEIVDPPPPPAPAPKPQVPGVLKVSTGVLQGKALSLPKPNYPAIARPIRLQGNVSVQILIDENGKVISAQALSGHPILIPEAQRAAMQARFSPTTLSGQPVKVSGVIIYKFEMQ